MLVECKTADEVRELARRVYWRRQKAMAPRRQRVFIKASLPERIPINVVRPAPVPAPAEIISGASSIVGWLGENPNKCPKVQDILTAVCREFGVAMLDITSQRRTKEIVIPKMAAMYLARHMTAVSLPEIGRRMGGRDHTTIMNGVAKTKRRIESDPAFSLRIDALKLKIMEGLHARANGKTDRRNNETAGNLPDAPPSQTASDGPWHPPAGIANGQFDQGNPARTAPHD